MQRQLFNNIFWSSWNYTVLQFQPALWGQPWGWCGPWWKWVWHPCSKPFFSIWHIEPPDPYFLPPWPGISGTALSLFPSYLNDRIYRVTWRGSVSKPCPLTTGVPQGYVLGPLPFLSLLGSLKQGFSWVKMGLRCSQTIFLRAARSVLP